MHALLIFSLWYSFILSVQQLKFYFQTMIFSNNILYVAIFFNISCKDPHEKHINSIFMLRNITFYLEIESYVISQCDTFSWMYWTDDIVMFYFTKPSMKTV